MDLAYLRAHPEHLSTFLLHQRIRETPVHGGSISAASRLTLDDGTSLFLKAWPDAATATSPGRRIGTAPPGFFAAEAAGLAWLRVDGGAAVPEIIAASDELIALEWIEEGAPTPERARTFGAALATTHRAGAPTFGAAWPGYIGALPLDNTPSQSRWSQWFGERRLAPYLKISRDRGALDAAEIALIEQLINNINEYAGEADAEPPARLHGDLWPGNLLWAQDRPVHLIDPAAHGGHRETDLAELSLFGGAPHLTEIIAGYEAVWPLATGWQSRVPLHQLHLLLVHVAMFGSGYTGALLSAIRATVER